MYACIYNFITLSKSLIGWLSHHLREAFLSALSTVALPVTPSLLLSVPCSILPHSAYRPILCVCLLCHPLHVSSEGRVSVSFLALSQHLIGRVWPITVFTSMC